MADPLQTLSNLTSSPSSPSLIRHLVPPSLRPFILLSYPSRSIASASSSGSGSGSASTSYHAHAHAHAHSHLHSLSSSSSSSPSSAIEIAAAAWHRYAPSIPSWASTSPTPEASSSHTSLTGAAGTGGPGTATVTLYGKGPADITFVLFCALAFTVLRHLLMRYAFAAFARGWLVRRDKRLISGRKAKNRAGQRGTSMSKLKSSPEREREREKEKEKEKGKGNGKAKVNEVEQRKTAASSEADDLARPMGKRKREHAVTRFAEQAWAGAYAACFWSIGMLVLSRLHSPLSPTSLWASYPVTPLPGLTKFYYLAQLGWWFHQIYVINTEKRRADHWQMFSHHCLTIVLIVGSYMGNFTRVGTVIHCLMDFCDILLCSAKCFRYLHLTTACDTTFVLFLLSWLGSRQMGLPYVIYSTFCHAPLNIPFKWSPDEGMFLTRTTYTMFLTMLVALLALCTVWFGMAVRVAVRVVRGQGAEDSRSDDEDEDEDEIEEVEEGEEDEEEERETTTEEDEEEEGDDDNWGQRRLSDVPSKGETAAGASSSSSTSRRDKPRTTSHSHDNRHDRHANAHAHAQGGGGGAGKTLSNLAERVGCKRDTMKDEAAVRRRR